MQELENNNVEDVLNDIDVLKKMHSIEYVYTLEIKDGLIGRFKHPSPIDMAAYLISKDDPAKRADAEHSLLKKMFIAGDNRMIDNENIENNEYYSETIYNIMLFLRTNQPYLINDQDDEEIVKFKKDRGITTYDIFKLCFHPIHEIKKYRVKVKGRYLKADYIENVLPDGCDLVEYKDADKEHDYYIHTAEVLKGYEKKFFIRKPTRDEQIEAEECVKDDRSSAMYRLSTQIVLDGDRAAMDQHQYYSSIFEITEALFRVKEYEILKH